MIEGPIIKQMKEQVRKRISKKKKAKLVKAAACWLVHVQRW